MKHRYLITYDIREDYVRFAVADICKEYNMERIQFSVFIGLLTNTDRKEIERKIQDAITDSNADVNIFPICTSCFKKSIKLISIHEEAEKKIEKSNVEIAEPVVLVL